MINLNGNVAGSAGKILIELASKIQGNSIIGAEFGIAYGGGVESIGGAWKNRGLIYGFDTFTGHPKEIYPGDPADGAMDFWYGKYGKDMLSIEYIQTELDKQKLSNVKLIKGLIDEDTNIDFIPYLNYVFLDLDFPLAMRNAYNLVEQKLVNGAYLCLHDVFPCTGIQELVVWYQEIKDKGMYKIVAEYSHCSLAVLQRL
jgi:hypothetical protein